LTHEEVDDLDVIIVGSGIGGLTAGALLTKLGRRVLVVEKHYNFGGCATVFHRVGNAYEFDVGVHHIGDCGPNGVVPRILRWLGIDDLTWTEQEPSGHDRFVFPDLTVKFPKGMGEFRRNLIEAFPAERAGIDRFLNFVAGVGDVISVRDSPWRLLMVLPQLLTLLRKQNATLGEFLSECTQDIRLQAVLAAQLGIYHLPPSRSSLVCHAAVVGHWLHGSYTPQGGGQILSDRLLDVIEEGGGRILLRTSVNKILLEKGRAVGVELSNKRQGKFKRFARNVVSNADYKRTLLSLVGREHLPAGEAERVEKLEMSTGMFVVYLGIKRDLSKEGMANCNIRLFPDYDLESNYKVIAQGGFPERPHLYFSNATLRSPHDPKVAPPGITNLQLMTAAPSSLESWGITRAELDSGGYRENPTYLETKGMFAARVIAEAERLFPNLARDIVYQETSTPISTERFIAAENGTSYGLAATPSQFLMRRPGARTSINNLFTCGASGRTGLGVFGSMNSALDAVGALLNQPFFVSRVLSNRVAFDTWDSQPNPPHLLPNGQVGTT
jgi:phytoene dehydrogenase-like protein